MGYGLGRQGVLVLCLALATLTACGDSVRVPRGAVGEGEELTWFGPGSLYDGGALVATPGTLLFEVQDIGVPVHQEVNLTNRGQDGLVIFRLGPQGGRARDIQLTDTELPFAIAVGETVPVTLTYTPQSCDPSEAALQIYWSNKDSSRLELPIETTGLLGQLSFEPEYVSFGRVGAYNQVSQAVRFENSGRCPLHIDGIEIDGAQTFTMTQDGQPGQAFEPAFPILVHEDSPLAFDVSYFTRIDVPEEAILRVFVREQEEPVEIPLSANARECPIAVAEGFVEAREDDRGTDLAAIPLETVYLDASESYDPDGEVVEYRWTTVERPDGSTAQIVPHDSSPNPRFFLDLAGDYTFQLDVIDADGMESCESAYVAVMVVPDEDIHVQLVWQTPGDNSPDDGNGTDLDLHFMRLPGSWDTEPWDCHWKNMTPDWGVVGESEDDPSLDIDDVDDFGPENINLNRPESGRSYGIGVYYYSDAGYGAAYATIRVFIDGLPVFEALDKELRATGYFWEVGQITWPVPEVDVVDIVHQFGFP